jgi:hypothetical protein
MAGRLYSPPQINPERPRRALAYCGQKNGLDNGVHFNLQPYKDLERFISDERVMRSIIDPGLLPIAKAISKDVLGRRILVTRRIASREGDQGIVAHIDGYGIRILVYRDETTGDTIVAWECLYGVA